MTTHTDNIRPFSENDKEETLAERSARLEAEAKAFGGAHTPHVQDPLAPEPLPAENEGAKIAALQTAYDDMKDQMIRAMAETENMRKRSVREREDATKYAVTGFAKDMLDVSDNLRRALEAMPADLVETDPRIQNLMAGIEVTERTLLKNFEKHGIRKIEPLGEIFNPNFHEVMFEAPIPGQKAGTIMQVMEAGYILHDRLLRPARVGVVKDNGTNGHGSSPPSSGAHIDTQA